MKKRGFTLIELICALGIIAIIFCLVYTIQLSGTNIYNKELQKNEVQDIASTALNDITNDIAKAGYATCDQDEEPFKVDMGSLGISKKLIYIEPYANPQYQNSNSNSNQKIQIPSPYLLVTKEVNGKLELDKIYLNKSIIEGSTTFWREDFRYQEGIIESIVDWILELLGFGSDDAHLNVVLDSNLILIKTYYSGNDAYALAADSSGNHYKIKLVQDTQTTETAQYSKSLNPEGSLVDDTIVNGINNIDITQDGRIFKIKIDIGKNNEFQHYETSVSLRDYGGESK